VQFVSNAKEARAQMRLSRRLAISNQPTNDKQQRQPQEINMKKFTTAVAVTLLGASLAFAAPHEGGKHWGHGKRGVFSEKLAQKLNLTDAQKEQVKAIKKDSFEQNKAFFQQSRQTMKQYFTAKKANDTATMDSLEPAVESQRAQMKLIRTATEAKIAGVLTPDQNTQWQQLKAERAARHQNHEQK
jgi:protein CpxP